MTENNSRTTAPDASGAIPSVRDGLDFADLAEQMAATPLAADDLVGDLTGTILAVAGIQRLPQGLRTPVTWTISTLAQPLWRGKRLTQTHGTNMFLSRHRPRTFGEFSRTVTPEGHAALDYNQPRNPPPVRRITGELASVGPATLLGAMYLNVGNRRTTLMYFTLER